MLRLLVSLALAAAPTVESDDRYALGLSLADQGRHAEAALHFETMVGDDPALHFEAGQMRVAAGHLAHAHRHFEAYLASGQGPESRSVAQSRLTKAAAGTRRVELRLTPATSTTVIVHRVGDPPDRQRPDLEVAVTAGAGALRLDPGNWELRIDKAGYLPLRSTLAVHDANVPVELRLAPVPVVATPKPDPTPADMARARTLRRARGETIAGAVIVPLGVLALAGLVIAAVSHRGTRAHAEDVGYHCNDLDTLVELRARARREVGAMVGLGVASGALLTAGAVLLVRGLRPLRRARLSLDVRPGQAGLTLSGNF